MCLYVVKEKYKNKSFDHFHKLQLLYEEKILLSIFTVNVASESEMTPLSNLHGVTIHSLSLVVSYQMTRARKIKSTLEWIISNSNENIMCS